jgi:hypothetical protein
MPVTPRFAAFETLPFGGVTRGQISGPQIVTVTNTGTGDLTFSATNGFTLGGANAAQFRLTPVLRAPTAGSCRRAPVARSA